MPIQEIENKNRLRISGTIRLGVRKKGSGFPQNVRHFVLDDAPELEGTYGKEPLELDVMFVVNDPNQSIPAWLMWWGKGRNDVNGDAIGGVLNCRGNGPDGDTPGVADFYLKRDPITGVTPTRPCMGKGCSDWLTPDRKPQCKPCMSMYVWLPHVYINGLYRISTTSWRSITDITTMWKWLQNFHKDKNGKGIATFYPLKLYKVEEPTKFFNPKTGREESGKQWIMRVKENPEYEARWGALVKNNVELLAKQRDLFLPPAHELVNEAAPDDAFDVEHEASRACGHDAAQEATPLMKSEQVVVDPEVVSLFKTLENTSGKVCSPKLRLMIVRLREKEPDIKAAVITAILQEIEKAKQYQQESPAQVVAQDAPAEPIQPATPDELAVSPDADGIL